MNNKGHPMASLSLRLCGVMHHWLHALIVAGCLLLAAQGAFGQSLLGQAGDSSAAPFALTPGAGGLLLVDMASATDSPDDPEFSCMLGGPGRGLNTVWFSFTATSTSAFLTTRRTGLRDDVLIGLFQWIEGKLEPVACSGDPCRDDNEDATSLCAQGLSINQEYIVLVGTYFENNTFVLGLELLEECPEWRTGPCYLPDGTCVVVEGTACAELKGRWADQEAACFTTNCLATPANDILDNAVEVSTLPWTSTVELLCATNDYELAWFAQDELMERGTWYSVQGTGGTLQARACDDDLHFAAAVLVLCGPTRSELDFLQLGGTDPDCQNGVGEGAIVTWCSELGRSYFIVVGNVIGGGVGGPLTVSIDDLGLCAEPRACCRADTSGDGSLAVDDIFTFLSYFFANDMRADYDRNGIVEVTDTFAFLGGWFAGCV